jgi:hypothetical protein
MAYAGITAVSFRDKTGSLSEKLAAQFAAVKTETDSIDTALASGVKVVKLNLTGVVQNGFSFAWPNPETTKILVWKFVANITTGANAGGKMCVGSAINATTKGDNLIDTLAADATGVYDNVTDKGTNGKPQIILDENGGTTSYITCQMTAATAASMDGKAYIFYTKV